GDWAIVVGVYRELVERVVSLVGDPQVRAVKDNARGLAQPETAERADSLAGSGVDLDHVRGSIIEYPHDGPVEGDVHGVLETGNCPGEGAVGRAELSNGGAGCVRDPHAGAVEANALWAAEVVIPARQYVQDGAVGVDAGDGLAGVVDDPDVAAAECD